MTIETFQPLLGSDFTSEGVTLRLHAVAALPQGRPDARAPFALDFRGPAGLPQHTYTLTHERLGRLDVFLVPVAPGQYEAIFN